MFGVRWKGSMASQRAIGDDGQKKVLKEQGRGWGGQMIQAGKG